MNRWNEDYYIDELLRRVRLRDGRAHDARDELFALLSRGGARAMGARLLRGRHDAEDVWQGMVARLIANPGWMLELRSADELRVFLGRALVAELREHDRRRARESDAKAELAQGLEETDSGPGDFDLREVIERLDPGDRIIVELLSDGYSATEIARRLDVTQSTARKRISIARARVQSMLRASARGSVSHGADAEREVELGDQEGGSPVIPTVVGPARIAVVWDPANIPPSVYSRIVECLGDVVREAGGRGVERIREQATGVGSDVRVPI